MKRYLVLLISIAFAAVIAIGVGHTLSNVWAGAYPIEEEQQVEPLATVNFRDQTVVQPINIGEAYYNGQLQTVQQVGSTLYLPTVERAVVLQPGEEPISFYGSTILFNPDTGTARTIDWNRDGYEAVMPAGGTYLPGDITHLPGDIPY